jgi:hypothetical protein
MRRRSGATGKAAAPKRLRGAVARYASDLFAEAKASAYLERRGALRARV